jgi:hypothetical protein
MPASLLLGALAPMPPPVATGPPGMMNVRQRQGSEDGWEKLNGGEREKRWKGRRH